PMRTFIRHKSHYLSTKWTKEPFSIGYPCNKDSPLRATTHQHLFPDKIATAYDYFIEEHLPNEWPHISYDEYSRYHRMAIEQGPSYITPPPTPSAGLGLLKSLTGNRTKNGVVGLWKRLSPEERNRLETPTKWQYQQQLRVWKGYEVVEYLKRLLDDNLRWNPYPLLGLYPWEIIKDKLRKKAAFQFEFDYYDTLIREAFGRNSARKAKHIFYTDLVHNNPQQHYTWGKVDKLFKQLVPESRSYYHEKEARRLEQSTLTRSPYHSLLFHRYLDQHANSTRPLLDAARGWALLDNNAKRAGEMDRKTTNSRRYKEQLLDIKTAIVMDYLYYTGGVEGIDSDYCWVTDRASKTHGYIYMNRGYYRGELGF
ncbi:uncharacterized protein CANTADRAFT_56550, partial [Suhomyces tanzawaensis NRRL Y-17324]